MIVQEPSASIAGMLRTITWALAMRRMPTASATEIATGSPSGIALTARPTAIRKRVSRPMPRRNPTPTSNATATPTESAMVREKRCIRIINGGCEIERPVIAPAIRPSLVAAPVAVTTPRPRPRTTRVPAKAADTAAASAPASFGTGRDSPVSSASSQRRPSALSSRRSAATRLPASSSTTSPGTSSRASMSCRSPSRSTVARGDSRFRSAVVDWLAEYS